MKPGNVLGFVIWTALGLGFVVMGIYEMLSKKEKPFGFWANAKTVSIENVKEYNRALGKLWIIFGIGMTLLGLPLLLGEESLIILSMLGLPVLCIVIMMFYTLKIEGKYRKK